jgi:hypothetical protein
MAVERDAMNTSQALREASDALLRDLEVLTSLEEEKRDLDPGDPRLVELAGRIEEIAGRVLGGTVRQHQLTQRANVQVAGGSANAPTQTIEQTERTMSVILTEWREAERRLAAADPDSADEAETRALIAALRDEYRRAYETARRNS